MKALVATRVVTPLLVAVVCLGFSARAEVTAHGGVPSYNDAPVFYEFFWDYFADMENLELMHEGNVLIGKLGVEPIENFDWEARGKSNSYWNRMHNFWYLTPLIESNRERDNAFVESWFDRWLDAHLAKTWTNYGAKDAMTAGFRVMTFVWYLHLLDQRGQGDPAHIERIKASVKEHQKYLEENFHAVSNHGYWESMGLFETTRVWPDTAMVRLSLARLDQMIRDGITDGGCHIERSPFYHLEVWNWIDAYVHYFRALGYEWPGREKLEAAYDHMTDANYYFCDHDRNVPQIGDTDVMRIDMKRARGRSSEMPPVFFDKDAGYAIYKDVTARQGRYVVFTVPSGGRSIMKWHNHNDVLAVYYANRGEIILGDAGRYWYTRDRHRKYFMSAAAHNTIMHANDLPRSGGEKKAADVLYIEGDDHDTFAATMPRELVTRVVRIPHDGDLLEVHDTIVDDGPYAVLWHLGIDVESFEQTVDGRVDDLGRSVYVFELRTARRRTFVLTIETDTGPPASQRPIEIVSGEDKPLLAWYSPGHGVKHPVPLIKVNLDVKSHANVSMLIKPRNY